MATTAQISSAFDISVTMDSAATHTIANPGRAFRVVQIQAYNAGGTPNITVTDGTNDIAATQATATDAWKNLALTEANCDLTSSENLVVTNANVSTTKLIVTCVATGGGQSLSVS
tara:strand:+ start:823 stop:1167 length:345 start_codon:yes stop_codon:yes gene_type:complete